MGLDGWPLSEIASWIERLGRLAAPLGADLQLFSSGVALAEGWAHGFLFGVHLGEATDPLTGLVTLPVLRHRLREVQLQCEALAIPIEQAFCIVVIDTDIARSAAVRARRRARRARRPHERRLRGR